MCDELKTTTVNVYGTPVYGAIEQMFQQQEDWRTSEEKSDAFCRAKDAQFRGGRGNTDKQIQGYLQS